MKDSYNDFSSEKKRIPAWCDRILYKVQTDLEGLSAMKKKYTSPDYKVGDHKPVAASFEAKVSFCFCSETFKYVTSLCFVLNLVSNIKK